MAASVRLRHLTAICLCGLLASPAMAETADKSLIPPPAYQLAAHHAEVPSAVLYAIALQESGIHLRGQRVPWPWTLNVAGQPWRFTTRAAACDELQDALDAQPNRRIDVGLGQINVGYHAHRVAHPCDLLDPYRNLRIAATILREQYRQGEDWLPAIGRYHRPAGGTPAARYRRSVHQHLSRVHGGPAILATPGRSLP